MKIVQLLPELNEGGVERGTMELSREFIKLGHESIVISNGGKLVSVIENDGGKHIKFDIASKNPFTALWRLCKLRRLLKELNPDVIHARSRVPAWLVYLANKTLHIPFVTTVHGFNSVNAYSKVMTYGDRIICVSNSIKEHIKRHYKTPEEKITVIPRGIDLEKFDPNNINLSFVNEFITKYSLENKFIVSVVGRITQLKDIETFIKAVALVKQNIPNIKALIVGGVQKDKENYFESLKKLIINLKLENEVIFTGSQANVAEIYALSDVVVSASKKPESFGRSVAEAIAMNTPVIATNHGGVKDIIIEGKNGFLVDVGDVIALSTKIMESKDLKFDGYKYIADNFSLEQMVENTLKVYQRTIERDIWNLFLVQTPFQLFNAVEAKNRFHLNQKNILIIIHKGNQKNLHQINQILDYDNKWEQIIQIDFFTRIQKLFYPLIVRKQLKKLNALSIDTIYVALYRNVAAHIINSLKHEQIILFDDGNSMFKTISFLDQKKEKKFSFLRKSISFIMLRDTNINFIYTSKIFTLFDTSLFKNLTNEIIRNDYSYFKTKIQTLTKEENVFFVGSRMIENGISKDTFESSLKYVVDFYHGINKQLNYIPHRYEDIEYLKILSKKYVFTLSPFSSIIEFEFISKCINPVEVATFRSTAVDTLKLIYDTNIRVFKIALDKIESDKKNEFELVYKNFEHKQYRIESME